MHSEMRAVVKISTFETLRINLPGYTPFYGKYTLMSEI